MIKIFTFAITNRIDKIGVEVRNRCVEDFEVWITLFKLITDGLYEVGFAEAGSTIEEEGIITITRRVNDVFGGRYSQVIIGADDKVIDGVFLVEAIM